MTAADRKLWRIVLLAGIALHAVLGTALVVANRSDHWAGPVALMEACYVAVLVRLLYATRERTP